MGKGRWREDVYKIDDGEIRFFKFGKGGVNI
jgi:hypothetical protein